MSDEAKSSAELEASPEVADALLQWFQSFDHVSRDCSSVDDLADGIVCYEVLSRIAPMYFDADGLTAGSGEVAIGNVKRLLLDLEVYYAEGLGLGTERVAELSAEGLASDKNPGQLQRLAELVLGAAALCEDNAEYVRTIMEMEPEQQRSLVPIIEQAMAASSTAMSGGASRPMRSDSFQSMMSDDLDESGSQVSGAGGTPMSPGARSSGAADRRVLALEIENQTLLDEKAELQARIDGLEAEVRGTVAANDDVSIALGREQRDREREARRVAELMEQVTEKDSELEKLRTSSDDRIRDLEAKLMERADEIDLLKGRVSSLSHVEASLKKAKQRLEAASDLKRVNKELEATNRDYLKKIVGFEETVKLAESRAESYRSQLTEAQSGKLEAERQLAAASSELAMARAKMEREVEQRKFAEEQLSHAGKQAQAGEDDESDNDSDAGGTFERVTPAMRERLMRLEIENERAKSATVEAASLKEQVTSLQEQLAQVTQELGQVTAKNAELEDARTRQAAMPKQVEVPPDVLEKLDAAQEQASQLQQELDEKDQAFTESQSNLQRLRDEKRALMERVRNVIEKFKRDKLKRQQEIEKLQKQLEAARHSSGSHVTTLKRKLELAEKKLSLAERRLAAQAREQGTMATAFYQLGLTGLSDDTLDQPGAWLHAAQRKQRSAREREFGVEVPNF